MLSFTSLQCSHDRRRDDKAQAPLPTRPIPKLWNPFLSRFFSSWKISVSFLSAAAMWIHKTDSINFSYTVSSPFNKNVRIMMILSRPPIFSITFLPTRIIHMKLLWFHIHRPDNFSPDFLHELSTCYVSSTQEREKVHVRLQVMGTPSIYTKLHQIVFKLAKVRLFPISTRSRLKQVSTEYWLHMSSSAN